MIIRVFSDGSWCYNRDLKPGDEQTPQEVHLVPDDFTETECADLARERYPAMQS